MDVVVLPGGHLLKRVSGGGGPAIFGSHFLSFFHSRSHYLTFVRSMSHIFRSRAIKISIFLSVLRHQKSVAVSTLGSNFSNCTALGENLSVGHPFNLI